MELLRREQAATGITAELTSVVARSPGQGLHVTAERLTADLIVVGSGSHGLLGRVFLGDDARAALNGASCAVSVATRSYSTRSAGFSRIGVGFDESPESHAALETAREIAEADGSELHALVVVDTITPFSYGALVPGTGEVSDEILRETDRRVAELPGVSGRAVYGIPGEELAIFSGEVDLLVVGSRSYGPVRRLMFGSTSRYLERHARCPLLVLPRTSANSAGDGEIDVATAQIAAPQTRGVPNPAVGSARHG
jgi:nucleotide-binding universal stress UspA family protein